MFVAAVLLVSAAILVLNGDSTTLATSTGDPFPQLHPPASAVPALANLPTMSPEGAADGQGVEQIAATFTPATVMPSTLPATAASALVASDIYAPEALAAQMLALVNESRQANELGPVAWDETAAQAALLHAQDMVSRDYFSHWNPEGLGPDHRYSFLGGEHIAMENLFEFQYTFSDGRGAPVEDWVAVIEQGQIGLMNSPGHRRNILDPAHTHVGIGMAYDEATGQFRLAQEFVNQYVDLRAPLPAEAALGEEIRVEGAFREGLLSNALLNVAFEPFPKPMTIRELERTSTYTSAAESLGDIRRIGLEFDERVTLDYEAGPGLYHIGIFVDLPTGQTQVVDHVLEVR